MNYSWADIVEWSIYFLAIINPASKLFLLASIDPPYTWKELWGISSRSSIAAFLILAFLAVMGKVLLVNLFHIDIYSLRIAGGMVLFLTGLRAVQAGRFYEKQDLVNIPDLSIVPLAAPLIAGPGAIAASISLTSTHGMKFSLLIIAISIVLNLLIMLSSLKVGKILDRVNAIGPIVRITGLIVISMAVQMVLAGVSEWMGAIGLINS